MAMTGHRKRWIVRKNRAKRWRTKLRGLRTAKECTALLMQRTCVETLGHTPRYTDTMSPADQPDVLVKFEHCPICCWARPLRVVRLANGNELVVGSGGTM